MPETANRRLRFSRLPTKARADGARVVALGARAGYWPCLRGYFVEVNFLRSRYYLWHGLPSYLSKNGTEPMRGALPRYGRGVEVFDTRGAQQPRPRVETRPAPTPTCRRCEDTGYEVIAGVAAGPCPNCPQGLRVEQQSSAVDVDPWFR